MGLILKKLPTKRTRSSFSAWAQRRVMEPLKPFIYYVSTFLGFLNPPYPQFVVKVAFFLLKSVIRLSNLSNENIKHWCFQISKTVSPKNHFGISIYILSWKHLFEIYFTLLRGNNELKINNFLTNIWRDNWRFSIWHCKRTPLKAKIFANSTRLISTSSTLLRTCAIAILLYEIDFEHFFLIRT